MSTLDEVAAAAKRLSAAERRDLIDLLEKDLAGEPAPPRRDRRAAREQFLALAGSAHSDKTDLSSDKYKHYRDVYGDQE